MMADLESRVERLEEIVRERLEERIWFRRTFIVVVVGFLAQVGVVIVARLTGG